MVGVKYKGSTVDQQNSVQQLTKFEEEDLMTLGALLKWKIIDLQNGISTFSSLQEIFNIRNNSTLIAWQKLNKWYGK